MHNHEKLQLREPEAPPTSNLLEHALGDSYDAYEAFQETLPRLEMWYLT